MRIPVDAIPRTGRTIALRAGEGWARDAVARALDAEPLALEGRIEIAPPKGPKIDVHASITTGGQVDCARCGEAFRFDLETEADLSYLPRAGTDESVGSEDEEVQLAEEELEIGWYADGELDLGDVVQELVALALPPRYTCTDQAACDARTEALLAASRPADATGHPGFAALKGFTNQG